MSQSQEILDYLLDGGRITQLDALKHFGCLRLSGRIHDLREKGYPIETHTIAVKKKNGDTALVAEYRMGE